MSKADLRKKFLEQIDRDANKAADEFMKKFGGLAKETANREAIRKAKREKTSFCLE